MEGYLMLHEKMNSNLKAFLAAAKRFFFFLIVAEILFGCAGVGGGLPINRLNNVVTVSETGGDFTNPVTAVESIIDSSETNPYLILIGPGVYTLTETLIMKPYVSIAGSGQKITKLIASISTSETNATAAVISGAENTSISNLTVENSGGSNIVIGIFNNNCSPYIHNVTVSASEGIYNYAIYNTNKSYPVIHYRTVFKAIITVKYNYT